MPTSDNRFRGPEVRDGAWLQPRPHPLLGRDSVYARTVPPTGRRPLASAAEPETLGSSRSSEALRALDHDPCFVDGNSPHLRPKPHEGQSRSCRGVSTPSRSSVMNASSSTV